MASDPIIGVIGLGLLGGAIAERFLWAGIRVIGFDRRAERTTEFGGIAASSAAEVFAKSPRVLLSLPDSTAVESVLAESPVRAGRVIIDTTTGDPERTAVLAGQLAQRGVVYLDATVLGSSDEARRGEVVVMAGGPRESCDACADLFQTFAKQWFHVGPSGSGARMKLVVNLVLGLNRAVLVEGLSFAASLGLDPAAALEVLRAGAAYSRAMDVKGPKMLAGDFAPQARLSQHLKDVGLIVEAAGRSRTPVPLSELHRTLLERLVAAGYGGEDNAAIIRAFRR